MTFIAKRSTSRTYMIGPVLDADGVAVTTCVVGNFKISKNGAAPAALDAGATLTHRHTGHYSIALVGSADLSTNGTAQVTIDDTVNSCKPLDIQIIDGVPYDAYFGSGATGLPNGIATTDETNYILELLSLSSVFGSLGGTGNDATHLHLNAAATSHADDELIGYLVVVKDATTSMKYVRRITDWVQSTNLATIDSALPFTPEAADTFFLLPAKEFQTGDSYALANGASGFVAIKSETATILADTNELQTDWANGGRLDLLIDGVKAKTDSLTFTVAGKVDANAQQFAGQTITAAAGVTIPASIASPTNITSASGVTVSALGNNVITTLSIADGAITDAKITVPAVSGVATGVLGMVVQTWRRFFKKATKSSTQIITYADDGTTPITTQTISSSGSDQTQGAGS
jgi:hypothetical protein